MGGMQPLRVLVVYDDHHKLHAILDVLDAGGYVTSWASDARDASDVLCSSFVDVVLADLDHAAPLLERRDVPVVVMAAPGAPGRADALARGARGVLARPFPPLTLFHTLDQAVVRSPVLVVDDDLDIRESVAEVLRVEGYEVMVAEDGADALASMRAASPALVLLDLMMPGIDGWQVFHEMQRDPTLAGIPVCVISAVAAHAPPAVAGSLQKPIPLTKLLQTVERHCRVRRSGVS